ncbi:hypothetical protein PPYR_06977 [Photinus pyralis]|uniref:Cytochrome P450 n=1 Tax=Photinus pyralis TaxID=7054 RepID=A0A5N4AP43_PHOPY|nr:cytochrome P450 4g15-like [Photinus pyralis]KAB0799097.1 hypothetical protein PPYR_06977 [Photinus pyralis]
MSLCTDILKTGRNIFLCLVVLTLTIRYVYHRWFKMRFADNIPGPKGWPFIGSALDFRGSPSDMLSKLCQYLQSSSVVNVWVGPKQYIFLTDPRDVEVILGSNVHINKSSEYDLFKPWLGNGLLISNGEKWRSDRKLIAPTFHLNVLKNFVEFFNANSREVVERLRNVKTNTFDCHDYMSETTLEMLLETVMGVNKRTQGESAYKYVRAVMKMCSILHSRHFKMWLTPDWVFKLSKYGRIQKEMLHIIHGLSNKVVTNKILEWGNFAKFSKKSSITAEIPGEKKRVAFLDLLVEVSQNENLITSQEIRDQVDTIMFEGHDTTTSAASFFLSLMAAHPDIQNKVARELYEIFGDSARPATFSDTLEMKYLERCLLETLRLYPPVPFIARKINEPVKLVSGDYILPPGCTVVVAPIMIHRREDIYPNPNQYNPDNFLPERSSSRNYYAFVPFSAGPRNCIGRKYALLQLKILLSTIMRNFHVRSHLTEKDFRLQGDVILKRVEGFQMSLEPRIN